MGIFQMNPAMGEKGNYGPFPPNCEIIQRSRKTAKKGATPTTAFPTGMAIEAAAGIWAAIRIATSAITTPKAPRTFALTLILCHP